MNRPIFTIISSGWDCSLCKWGVLYTINLVHCPCMSFSFRRESVTLLRAFPLGKGWGWLWSGQTQERSLSVMFRQSLVPFPKLLFKSLVTSVPFVAVSVQGVTAHDSSFQRNYLLSEYDLLLGVQAKPFHCQFLSSCDQDKVFYVYDPRLPPGMPQKGQVCLSWEKLLWFPAALLLFKPFAILHTLLRQCLAATWAYLLHVKLHGEMLWQLPACQTSCWSLLEKYCAPFKWVAL